MEPGFDVLVIDDDRDVVNAARLALAGEASRIENLLSLETLESRLDSASFDVVLLDMNFGAGISDGRGGIEGLTRIQSADPTLAVVLMTAYAGVTLAVESLKRGAVDFVMKPWRNDHLIETLRAAIEVTHQRRQSESLRLDTIEKQTIERALQRHQGNISLAAAALGLSRAALYRRKARYDL